jgi:hypothetical protein
MSLNIQTPVTGITGMLGTAPFENYMAATVEEIKIGRNPVTSIAPLPNRVFDVLWKLNLNTALASIRSPSVIDASEQSALSGIPISHENNFTYTLTTNGLSKDFTALRLNSAMQTGDPSTVYKIIYGEPFLYSPTIYYNSNSFYTVFSYDGNYIAARNSLGHQSVYNTKTKGILSFSNSTTRGVWNYFPVKISDDALTMSYNNGASSSIIIETFKLNVGFTGSVVFSSAIGSTGGITGTNDGSVVYDMSSSGNTIVYSNATTLNRYEYKSGTNTWDIKGMTGCGTMTIISSNSDCSRVACFNATNVYIYTWTTSWNLEATIPMSNVKNVKFSRLGNILVIGTTTTVYIYNKNPTWVQHSSFSNIVVICPVIYINPNETSIIINNYGNNNGWQIEASKLYEYNGATWVNIRTDNLVTYQFSPDWTIATATSSSRMYSVDSTLYSSFGQNIEFLFYTNNIGIGTNEKECCEDLASRMATDGTNIILLDSVNNDVYSSIALKLTSVVSSSILNSLSDTTQSTVLTSFLTSLKSITGTYNWYSANVNNAQSVQTQVKLGLAQLFDKNPQLNNLIGSASSSSTFLDSSKIATKMQLTSDTFYTKFFSDQQLREVLSAVADKGSRISKLSVLSGGLYNPSNKFNFSVGDTISAMLKVTDIDTTSLNSDRWMITLQHAV